MTVLVTGGLGFIGSKVVLQLLKKDIDVLVTDLNIVKNKDKLESNILKIGKNKDKGCDEACLQGETCDDGYRRSNSNENKPHQGALFDLRR